MRHSLFSLALIASFTACKQQEKASETTGNGKDLQSGFYFSDDACDAGLLSGTLVSDGNFSFAAVYVKAADCGAGTVSNDDVIAFGVEPIGDFDKYVAEFTKAGYSASFGETSIVFQNGDEKVTLNRKLGSQDPNKQVTAAVSNLKIEKDGDQRKISMSIRVNGPELTYEPSVWCDSQVQAGNVSRLSKVSLEGASPSFTMQAVVNDPGDDNRYSFPAKCQASVGLVPPAGSGFAVLDILFGSKFSVE